MHVFLHVDMDAFFASVEVLDDPRLAGKPVLVGGAGRRGVVAAASYEARRFGCRSAQPMAVALRLCPMAVVRAPRGHRYQEISRQVFAIFERYTPLVEPLSIDEAFLDVTGSTRRFGPGRAIAEQIRAAVHAETGLTCSVGVASVKFLAKIASAHQKPDGLTEVAPGAERAFLDPLAVGDLWGVGPRTAERLDRIGVRTVGDLARLDPRELERRFGAHGRHLSELAHGRDPRRVVPHVERKQISHEDTYEHDLVGVEAIRARLLEQATRVADRLVAKGVQGRRVHLKIRDGDFVTETRQRTLERPTHDARVLYAEALALLDDIDLEGRGFRLTGVGVSELEAPRQLELFTEPGADAAPARERLQAIVSDVRSRFGAGSLTLGATPRGPRPESTR